ncbi:MAG: ATP-dependent DNA helicase RecG [Clostridium sp.]|nr:ATP-dependent DNA helicase RecG [Clostridium sp.]
MKPLRETDIKYLKGVGPKRAELLDKQLGIKTFFDLLHHFPTHYVDRTTVWKIRSFGGEMPMVQVRGRFVTFTTRGEGAKLRLVGLFTDGSATMEVVWFRSIQRIKGLYDTRSEYVIFGKPAEFAGTWSMAHPEVDKAESIHGEAGMRGVYPLTERLRTAGFSSKTFFTLANQILSTATEIPDPLPRSVIERLRLMPLRQALVTVHNPRDPRELQRARERLKFDELFMLQLNILRYARRRQSAAGGFRFSRIGRYFNDFYNRQLPFPLTEAQKRVIREIRADMGSGRQMNRLLQGDVGSGKTLVALMTMLIALDNDTQACLMAPTEILATQHFDTLSELVAPLGVNIKLLTGSTPARERAVISEQLLDGSLHILVGTHAVIEENVRFRNLGFAVIDEQHRFGVAQRARMWRKNRIPPHVLVMTATPIPRTLAMTVYGDLDVSVIDELPPGRKPVHTLLRYDSQRLSVYQGITRQLRQGRQAYIVYPLIKENEKVDLRSLEEGYEQVCETFRSYRVAYVHGRMRPAEKDEQMQRFANQEADILVATTVIEVGVNVPNATTMVIENAERFGLSQLHQLRGRVGRGEGQSFCVLMTRENIAPETRRRLEIMTSTTDGFVVAEADLKMRGPGDLEGTMQSGVALDLKIASLVTDGQIVAAARQAAEEFLAADPSLTSAEGRVLAAELAGTFDKTVDWGRIS